MSRPAKNPQKHADLPPRRLEIGGKPPISTDLQTRRLGKPAENRRSPGLEIGWRSGDRRWDCRSRVRGPSGPSGFHPGPKIGAAPLPPAPRNRVRRMFTFCDPRAVGYAGGRCPALSATRRTFYFMAPDAYLCPVCSGIVHPDDLNKHREQHGDMTIQYGSLSVNLADAPSPVLHTPMGGSRKFA